MELCTVFTNQKISFKFVIFLAEKLENLLTLGLYSLPLGKLSGICLRNGAQAPQSTTVHQTCFPYFANG